MPRHSGSEGQGKWWEFNIERHSGGMSSKGPSCCGNLFSSVFTLELSALTRASLWDARSGSAVVNLA